MAGKNKKHNTRTVLETQQVGWMKLREKVVTDDAITIFPTTQNFANRNSGTGNAVAVPYGINGIIITFFGIATDQTLAFKWRLYGYRELFGPGQLIANGTGNLGDVAVVTHPKDGTAVTAYYADYLDITAQYWHKTVVVKDIGAKSSEIATIMFDGMGISHLLLELTNCNAGTANETDELEAVFTGF